MNHVEQAKALVEDLESQLETAKAKLKEERATTQAVANKEIATLLASAYDSIRRAERIADIAGVSFEFGVTYGMGGTYYGEVEEDTYYGNREGWVSSSNSC